MANNKYRLKFQLGNGTELDAGVIEVPQGETGKSAYKYAQQNGYIGTEEEYSQDVNPTRVSSKIDNHQKRIENIENALYPDIVTPVTDDSAAYIKDVPLNALPNAEVAAVGGMTRKCTNLAPPFNIGYIVGSGYGQVESMPGNATTDMIPVNISGDNAYTWSSMANTLYSAVYFYNADKQYLGSSGATSRTQFVITKATLTRNLTNAGGDIAYIRLWQGENANTSGTVDLVEKQPAMLNKGSTALPYEPYFEGLRSAPVTAVESVGANGIIDTLPIPEAVQALEGYGEGVSVTCFNYIDFEKKQFIKRMGKIDLGTLEWYISSDKVFFTPLPAGFIKRAYMVSNDYGKTSNKDKNIWLGSAINIRDDSITTAAELKTVLSGVMLYCEFKEPVITDISHLLSDDNYIPVEGGGTITMVNEHSFAVPSTIEYTVKGASAQ
jgi:hypothetical protein